MNSLLLILGLIAVLLLVVVVYYGVRLLRVSRQARDSASRLQTFVRQQALLEARMAGLGEARRASSAIDAERVTTEAARESAGSDTVTCDPVGLASISREPVFLLRDPSGQVAVQLGTRPPSPLRYVLDPKTRHILELVVSQATLSFGYSWSILASEDEESGLSLRRLG